MNSASCPPPVDLEDLLQPFRPAGVNLGLVRIQTLLDRLGNPQAQIPVVHVAGTNGKGSVCAYLESVLTAASYRVGKYISPHLVSWCERITVSQNFIEPEHLRQLVQKVIQVIQLEDPQPTLFEVMTAVAWVYFQEQAVDLAILEVGLGGRLDATNLCQPLVTIMTSISRDHWQVLGDSLTAIASEKAGILKPNCPIITGPLPPEATQVVKTRSQALQCPLQMVEPAEPIPSNSNLFPQLSWFRLDHLDYPVGLVGPIQATNSAIAIAALQELQNQGWNISEAAIINGMARTTWPGRLQWVIWQGHQILVDGAHNQASAAMLRTYLDSLPISKAVSWIIGMLSTKDHPGVLQSLLRPGDRLYTVPVPSHSTIAAPTLATLASQLCPNLGQASAYPDLWQALDHASQENPDGLIVLCGSLYLLGCFFEQNSQ